MTEYEMLIFLKARPTLKRAIETDVVSCGGPGGQVSCVNSLVFQHDPAHESPYCCHYAVCVNEDDIEWGSTVDCTEEDYEAGLACGLDMVSQGFEVPQPFVPDMGEPDDRKDPRKLDPDGSIPEHHGDVYASEGSPAEQAQAQGRWRE
jgi:hypothetical protein